LYIFCINPFFAGKRFINQIWTLNLKFTNMLTKEHAKIAGIVLVTVLGALAFHQTVVAPYIASKMTKSPSLKA
jgi:hypothetical protein